MKVEGGWAAAAAMAVAATVGISSFEARPAADGAASAGRTPAAVAAAAPLAKTADIFEAGPCKEIGSLLKDYFLTRSLVAPGSCYGENAAALPAGATSPAVGGPELRGLGLPASETTGTGTPAPEMRARAKHLRFVIATLPDPLYTHFSLAFDRATEAIQQAVQDEHYLYDSSWLPWDEEVPYVRLEDRDVAEKRKDLKEDQPGVLLFRGPLYDQTQRNGPPHYSSDPYENGLVVFLVGEEPTGGIHREQFKNAVAWIEALQPRAETGAVQEHPVRMLGPSFTGSLPSLAALLSDKDAVHTLAPGPGQSFEIFSGYVTSTFGVRWLLTKATEEALAPLRILFASFQHSDEVTESRYCQYLAASGSKMTQLAIVSEDETAFGSERALEGEDHAALGNAPGKTPDLVGTPGRRDGDSDASTAACAGGREGGPTYLYYPRDISALRAAYQSQSIFNKSTQSGAETGRRTLQSDLADPEIRQHDTIRNYSGTQTALSQEAELQQIVSMLRAHRAEYILLRSSNPLDQLFLSHYLRFRYPEGRVIVMGADLLLRRETGAGGLNGILTLSTYPLLPWEPDWTGLRLPPEQRPFHSHRVYTNDGAEGTYIASRFLLQPGPPEWRARYQRGFADGLVSDPTRSIAVGGFLPLWCGSPADLRDYTLPFWIKRGADEKCHQPPTWLSVLGDGGFWPVASLDHQIESEPMSATYGLGLMRRMLPTVRAMGTSAWLLLAPGSAKGSAGDEPYRWVPMPLSMKLCLTTIFFWALFHALCCCRPSMTTKPAHRANFVRSPGRIHPGLILFGSLLISLAATVAAWGYGEMSREGEPLEYAWLYRLLLAVLWGMVGAALGVKGWVEHRLPPLPVVWAALRRPQHARSRGRWLRRLWNAGGITLAAYLASSLALYYLVDLFLESGLHEANRIPTYWRSMNLTTGVSPLLPLMALLVGLYGWFWYSLQGLALFGCSRPLLPSQKDLMVVIKDGGEDQLLAMLSRESAGEPLEGLCAPVSTGFFTVAALNFVAVIIIARLLSSDLPVRSLGATDYSLVCGGSLVICISVLLANAWQLMQVWLKLRHLLLFLDKLPLRRTLSALSGFSWGSVWKMSGSVLDVREKLMYRQFEALNHLGCSLESWKQGDAATRALWTERLEDSRAARLCYVRWYSRWWSQWSARDRTRLPRVQQKMTRMAAQLLTEILIPAWREECNSLALIGGREAEKGQQQEAGAAGASGDNSAMRVGCEAGGEAGGNSGGGSGNWRPQVQIRNAEEVVCLVYMGFIQNILGRMRSLVVGMIWLFMAIAVAVSSYPFDPRSLLSGAVIVLFVTLGSVIVVVYSQMHRDATLSHLTNTKPGELGSEFWLKLVGFGVGPVLGLVASVFPEFADFFFSWLQPGMASIK